MKTTPLLLIAVGLVGCRVGAPVSSAPDVGAYVADARAGAATAAEAKAELDAFEAKTRALVEEWDAKLAQPGRMELIRDFSASAYTKGREVARDPLFARSLRDGLTETALLAAAFERNPKIRAAHLKLRGAVNQYAQVTYLDAILSQYASFQRSSMTRVGMPLAGERMDQRFPFPGSLELKAALVKHSVEEARARYAGTVRDVVVEARGLLAGYVFVGQAIEITQATLEYLKQVEEAARSKLSAGTGPKGAVIQVQVEIANLRNDLVTLGQRRGVLGSDIARLVDVPVDTEIGPVTSPAPPSVPPKAEPLRQRALKNQPDVQAVEARLRRMQTMIELAEQTAYPPFSAGLSTFEDPSHATGGSDKEREPFSPKPKIKPDPWFGTKEAYLREARESTRAAEASVRNAQNRTVFRVEAAFAELETAQRLHELYRDVQLAQAEQAYRDAAAGYESDRVEFLNVVDSLRRWLRFRLEADRAIRDLHTSHARLEGAVGRGLRGETD